MVLSIAVLLSLVLLGMLIYGMHEDEEVISGAPQCAPQPPAHLSTRTPIKHVVIIFLENHSTDNLFGDYPANASLGFAMQSLAANSFTHSPINLKPVPVGVYSTEDPNEGYIPYHADWNGGEMNGWEYGSGPQSLYYYTSAQAAPLWDLAEEYGLGVYYFSPYLSESAPNHLFLYAAYSPVIDDYGPPPYVPVQESIFAELCRYGVSWGYYVDPREPVDYLDIKYFYGIHKYSPHIQSWGDFIEEIGNGSLPDVAWMIPSASDSMGPPGSILYGEAWAPLRSHS